MRHKYGVGARIVLSKMDVKGALRQVGGGGVGRRRVYEQIHVGYGGTELDNAAGMSANCFAFPSHRKR